MALKLKTRTQFPASVSVAAPLILEKNGVRYSFSIDVADLTEQIEAGLTDTFLPIDEAYRVFNLRSYGAVGDGSTLDNTAIAAAFAAAKAIYGGTVFIPAGNYRYNQTIDLDDAVTVRVLGESGQFSGGNTASVLTFTGAGSAISLRNAVGCSFENLGIVATEATRILDFRGDGQSSSANKVVNCLVSHTNSGTPSTSRACIDILDNENFCVENTTFGNSGMIGIRGVDAGVADYVINCHIKNCVFPSVAANSVHIAGPSNSWLIESCSFEIPSTVTCIRKGSVAGRSSQVTLISNWFGDSAVATGSLVTTNSANFTSIGNTYATSIGGGGASVCVSMDNSSGTITSIGDWVEADVGFAMGTGNRLNVIGYNTSHPPTALSSGTLATGSGTILMDTLAQVVQNKTIGTTNVVTIRDDSFAVAGSSDSSKLLRFEVDGFTTATTRTVTVPNANTTMVGTDVAQALSNKTIGQTNVIDIADNAFTVSGSSDGTKKLAFEVDGFTTATTRTVTVPNASFTMVGADTTQTLTNKTYDTAGAGNSFSINGVAVTANTGTGAVARATSPAFTTPDIGVATGTSLAATGLIKSSSATAGIGYATGAGSTVTQLTDKTTGVTINNVTGQITMNNSNILAGAAIIFTVTNSAVAATDVIVVNIKSGATAAAYTVLVGSISAGAFQIQMRNNTAGTLGEAVVLQYAVIKGVNS